MAVNFLADGTTVYGDLPDVKEDGIPLGMAEDPDEFLVADEFNALNKAVNDGYDFVNAATNNYYGLTDYASPPSPAGLGGTGEPGFLYLLDDGTLHLLYEGNDLDLTSQTLQGGYDNGGSSPTEIVLDSTRDGIIIKDADPTIGTVLFGVRADDDTPYFEVNKTFVNLGVDILPTATDTVSIGSNTYQLLDLVTSSLRARNAGAGSDLFIGGGNATSNSNDGGDINIQVGAGKDSGGGDTGTVTHGIVRFYRHSQAKPAFLILDENSGNNYALLTALAASGGGTTQDAPDIILRGHYWDGAISQDYDCVLRHDITATSPTSKFAVRIGGNEKLAIASGGAATFYGAASPNTDATLDLGSSSTHWGVIHGKRGSLKGTSITSGDIGLSGGWGNTASVGSVSGDDSHMEFTVTSAGTGQGANPTITITFKDGTWTTAPFVHAIRNGGAQATVTQDWTTSATQAVITWRGTPVAAETFTFSVWTLGAN